MRLFCAIEPSEELRDRLLDVPRAIGARGFRLVDRAQLHLTVRFLGDVDDALFPALGTAIEGATIGAAPFTLHVGGAGTFAPRGSPRVLWAGVEDTAGRLAALAAAVDVALAPILGARDLAFKPHVTLGRGKEGANVDVGALSAIGSLGIVRVDELLLFESITSSTGAQHTVRARVRLGR